MTPIKSPLEKFLARHWGDEPERLLSLLEQRFGIRVEADQLRQAADARSFAETLKHQVDHPGRLERVAERLLGS